MWPYISDSVIPFLMTGPLYNVLFLISPLIYANEVTVTGSNSVFRAIGTFIF